jgi:hypothetical protein
VDAEIDCKNCRGKGFVKTIFNPDTGQHEDSWQWHKGIQSVKDCGRCRGKGTILTKKKNPNYCSACRGSGQIRCKSCRGRGATIDTIQPALALSTTHARTYSFEVVSRLNSEIRHDIPADSVVWKSVDAGCLTAQASRVVDCYTVRVDDQHSRNLGIEGRDPDGIVGVARTFKCDPILDKITRKCLAANSSFFRNAPLQWSMLLRDVVRQRKLAGSFRGAISSDVFGLLLASAQAKQKIWKRILYGALGAIVVTWLLVAFG